jgi:hypothetical protein
MFKNLFVLILVCLTGCIWVVDPAPSRAHQSDSHSYDDTHGGYGYGSGDVWIENYYIECHYDSYWNESRWYVEVDVGSTYAYYSDEVEVDFYIDTWDWFWTEYSSYGDWYRVFESGYYHCYESHTFDFVVTDIYGSTDSVSTWW